MMFYKKTYLHNRQVLDNSSLHSNINLISKAFEGQYMAAPYQLDEYYTLNFHGQYEISKHFTLFADLQNLTNQEYFTTRGYNSKRFNVMGGVRIRI